MGMLAWIGGRIDQTALASCEKALDAVLQRATLDADYAEELRTSVCHLLTSLSKAAVGDPAAALNALRDALAFGELAALDKLAHSILNQASQMERVGCAGDAAAGRITAGWIKVGVLARESTGAICGRASALERKFANVFVALTT